jgi:integrase
MARRGITLQSVRALALNSTVWDGTISGFGARRQLSDVITYFLKYRTADGRQRWYTIGRHGSPWTPDTARQAALRLLGEITGASTDGVKSDPALGKETARTAPTVNKLCDLYLEAVESGRLLTKKGTSKTAATLASDKARISRHIKPLLGDRAVASVTSKDVEDFQHKVTNGETSARNGAGRGAATRTLGLLGAIFTFAVGKKLRTDNPVRGIVRAADDKCDRRIAITEYAALGKALREAETAGIWPAAVAVVRFLVLTGWRKSEAERLAWGQVDLDRRVAILAETKTGRSGRPLSQAACEVLQAAGRPNGGLVFAGPREGVPLNLHDGYWDRIIALAGLPADITPHVLRHSFASEAADLNYSDSTIAQLIGHKGKGTTSRYIHGADPVLLAAADATANRIAALLAG